MNIILIHKNVVSDGRLGGFSTVYYNLAKSLATRGHQITVVTRHKCVSDSSNICFFQVDHVHGHVEHSNLINTVLNNFSADIVECPSWDHECWAYSQKSQHLPIVIRGDIPAAYYGQIDDARRESQMMKSAQSVLAVSNFIERCITTEYKVKVDRVIYNGVNMSLFNPSKRVKAACSNINSRRIVWVGRPSKMKGYSTLEKIVNKAPKNFIFDLVVGEAKDNLLANFIDAKAHVNIHKNLSIYQLVFLYNQADVVLSTSLIEGFGLSIVEAMACAVPAVIPHDCGGLNEIVVDKAGYSYSEYDEAIEQMMLLSPNNAVFAQERASRFSWDLCAVRTLEVYNNILLSRE